MKMHWLVAVGLVMLGVALGADDGASQKGEKKNCVVEGGETVYQPTQGRPGEESRQGWTDEERCQFYHFSQNARLLDYMWFISLEDPWKPGTRFVDNLARYGLLPDEKSPFNPDGLPIGLAKTDNPYIRPPQVGFTCAFCHTGQIAFKGKRYRIDGGPSMQQNAKFLMALGTALRLTLEDPKRFERFAENVLVAKGKKSVLKNAPIPEELKAQLRLTLKLELLRFSRQGRIDPVEWGPGRFDALGRGGNMIFYESQLRPQGSKIPVIRGRPLVPSDNLRPANGPVSLPYLWGAWERDWVLWSGVIQSPVARAMVESLSIDTKLEMEPDLEDPFPVDVQRLIFLDEKGKQLQPPLWPKEFGAIDEALKARGQELFGKDEKKGLCARCHFPTPLPSPTPHGQRWHASMSPLSEIGTDKLTARNWFARQLELNDPLPELIGTEKIVDMPFAIHWVTQTVIERHKDTMLRNGKNVEKENNLWRRGVDKYGQDCKKGDCQPGYMAHPLDGAWATAPYLHNGSVPSLYTLLSPIEERPLAFCVGPNVEFDPEKVGLTVRECPETVFDPRSVEFHFDAGKAGNRNIGHEFRGEPGKPLDRGGKFFCDDPHKRPEGVLGCGIKPEDRKALVEYLKTIETPGLWSRTQRDRSNQTAP